MANSSERALPPMDLSGSASKVAERWRQWKRSYEYYIDGKRITQAGRKKSQLLHLAGLEVQDIFEDLVDRDRLTQLLTTCIKFVFEN